METHFDNDLSKARSIYIRTPPEIEREVDRNPASGHKNPTPTRGYATNPLAEQTHALRELQSRELNRTVVPLSPNLSHPYQKPKNQNLSHSREISQLALYPNSPTQLLLTHSAYFAIDRILQLTS